MKDRRRPFYFDASRWIGWFVITFWIVFGVVACNATRVLMAPVTTAVQSIEIKQ